MVGKLNSENLKLSDPIAVLAAILPTRFFTNLVYL
jgi:hypothetical protein